jgi:hypothetical protein
MAIAPASASAAYAPVDAPGPSLSVPTARLAAAMKCSSTGIVNARRAPVLLLQGTGATAEDNWSWNYEPALTSRGIGWCSVDSPQRATGDIQIAGEYVVHAIRELHRRSGRRVSIIGQSQGGMVGRWPLRFWPDTRPLVEDVIGIAPSNHGTVQARRTCVDSCSPANWQQRDNSAFMGALNSFQETFTGISYTNIYTKLDLIVQPNKDDNGSSSLHGGGGRIENVAVQDVCAIDPFDHLTLGTVDPVAYQLAMDALDNEGPASTARVAARGCAQAPIPGLRPEGGPKAALSFFFGRGADEVPAEPALRCYVTGTCPASASRLRVEVAPRRARVGVVTRVRVRVRARVGGRVRAVRGAVVRVGSRRARTARNGRVVLRVRFGRGGRRAVSARARGYGNGRAALRVLARRR